MEKSIKSRTTRSRGNVKKGTEGQELLGVRTLLPRCFASKEAELREFVNKVVPISGLVVQMQEELREMVMESGMKVLEIMLEEDRKRLVGERYKHQSQREAERYGYTRGKVVCGGRKISINRPRVRTEKGEVQLPTYQLYSKEDPLDERTVKQILMGVPTRKYEGSLEEMPDGVETSSTSRSAASRRFVRMTQDKLDEKMAEPIVDEVVGLLIDGVEIAEYTVVMALGVTVEGKKKVLGLREGSTENATVCRELLRDLVERGFPADKRFLAVIDGGKGCKKALAEVFGDNAVVARCQVHKKRNVSDHLPSSKRPWVKKIMNEAYAGDDFEKSKSKLLRLAETLEEQFPSAASSLREGLEETLTMIKLGLPMILRKSFSSTNMIESMLSRVRDVQKNVKRWRNGKMILRWTCIGSLEAEKKFRRVKGYSQMPVLVNALINYKDIAEVA